MPGPRRSTGPARSGAAARAGRRRQAGEPSRGSAGTGPASVRRVGRRGPGTATVAAVPSRLRSQLTRQVAVFGIVCAAVALVLVFPVRSYLAAQADLTSQRATEAGMRAQLASLVQQRAALSDPNYVRIQARSRLQYVDPGDTVYVVHAPAVAAPATAPAPPTPPASPWYAQLWDTLNDPAAGHR